MVGSAPSHHVTISGRSPEADTPTATGTIIANIGTETAANRTSARGTVGDVDATVILALRGIATNRGTCGGAMWRACICGASSLTSAHRARPNPLESVMMIAREG